jgi:hypothetical protein
MSERIERTAQEEQDFTAAVRNAAQAQALGSLARIRDAIERQGGSPFCSHGADHKVLGYLESQGLVSHTIVQHPSGKILAGVWDRIEWVVTPAGAAALADAGL